MYKKLLLLLVILSAFTNTFAFDVADKELESKVDIALTKAVETAKPLSQDASEKSVLKFTFKTETEVAEAVMPVSSRKECAAVVIDNQWLLASKTCKVLDPKVVITLSNGGTCEPSIIDNCKVLSRSVSDTKIEVAGKKYPVEIALDGEQILLFARDKDLVKQLSLLPKANVLFVSPKSSPSDFRKFDFFVNRKSYLFDIKEVQEREIASLCISTACINVKYAFFHTDAQAGDPLFVTENGNDFLVAFNSAQNYTDGKNDRKSREFIMITAKDISAIKKVIGAKTPSALASLNKRIMNEQSAMSFATKSMAGKK